MDNIDPEKTSKALIVKHNDLIEARYQAFSVVEQRIILMLLAQIQKDDKDFKGYRISVSDFSKITGIPLNGSFYQNLKNTLNKLVSKTIHIRRNHGGFLVTTWLSSGEYIDGKGCIELCFDPKLKPYLLNLQEKYTKYKLEIAVNFKSQFSIRLYEILKKQAQIEKDYNHRKSFEKTFLYEELRNIFAVEEKEYLLFAHFRTKTIEPAVREVSDKTDLHITETKYIKTGRKITAICFCVTIRGETETQLRQNNLRIEDMKEDKNKIHPAIQALIDNGFSFENAKTYKTKYGIKQIERNLAYMQAEERNGKKIENRPAYLASAIREDWGKYREEEIKAKAERDRKRIEAEKIAEQKAIEEERKRKAHYERAFTVFEEMEKTKQDELIFEYKNTAADPFSLEQIRKAEAKGENIFTIMIVKATFIKFLIDKGF